MSSESLDLEQLLMHPDFPEMVQRFREAAPVDLLDQADAATSEASRGMLALADHLGVEGARGTPAAGIPAWLRSGLLDTVAGWLSDRGETCRHSPHPARPGPVLGAAWRPGLVTCPPCGYLLAPRGQDDSTCDSCGKLCDTEGAVFEIAIQFGPLIFLSGVCADCKPLSAPLSQDPGPVVSGPRVQPRGGRGRGRGKGGRR